MHADCEPQGRGRGPKGEVPVRVPGRGGAESACSRNIRSYNVCAFERVRSGYLLSSFGFPFVAERAGDGGEEEKTRTLPAFAIPRPPSPQAMPQATSASLVVFKRDGAARCDAASLLFTCRSLCGRAGEDGGRGGGTCTHRRQWAPWSACTACQGYRACSGASPCHKGLSFLETTQPRSRWAFVARTFRSATRWPLVAQTQVAQDAGWQPCAALRHQAPRWQRASRPGGPRLLVRP